MSVQTVNGELKREKFSIYHVNVQLDKDYLFELLDAGAYIEFDNFGNEFFLA